MLQHRPRSVEQIAHDRAIRRNILRGVVSEIVDIYRGIRELQLLDIFENIDAVAPADIVSHDEAATGPGDGVVREVARIGGDIRTGAAVDIIVAGASPDRIVAGTA